MKAVRVHALGGPEVMQYEDVDVPRPGPGEVLIKISATGLNYLDVQYRIGRVKAPLPFTNGTEAAGVVSEVGSGVTDVKVGDRVAYTMILGTYAEYALAPAARLVPVPANLDLRTAAAALLQGLTAHYLTHSTYPLKAGETALVHAAAGGIGNVLTQVARIVGAQVIATVGSDAKAELARQAGAHHVINYSTQDFEQEVKKLTEGRGVHVVYDSVGKDTFDKSLNCLRHRGYLALFGFSSGLVPPFDPAILGIKGSLFLTRPGLNQYIATRDELMTRARDLFKWIGDGSVKIRINHTFPLADAVKAHQELEARRTTGKVLLDVS
ncbi:MAG TPA: quinone oxidoreductase [Vicinamibacterales bacterium]|nr:quinone oxidoreductase [Vicinamibacterales bacterium]